MPKTKKKIYICQECGYKSDDPNEKHSLNDCAIYHLIRAKELLDIAVVAGENKQKFVNLMVQWNIGQVTSGELAKEIWNLFNADIIATWIKTAWSSCSFASCSKRDKRSSAFWMC